MSEERTELAAWGFAAGNLFLALLLGAVLVALPKRWWGVDVPMGLGALLLAGAALGLARRTTWGAKAARAAAGFTLVAGLGAFAALCLAAAYVYGVHGILGRGVSLAYAVVILPVATWLVVYPAVQLVWLRRR